MNPILSKLEHLARKARARAPSRARDLLDRLEAAYRTRRGGQPEPASAAEPAPAAAPEPVARPKPVNWELRTQTELADHIEQHYHAGLRRDLPLLIERARKLEREYAGHASLPDGLADALAELFGALDSHMLKEEHMLFPTIRSGMRGGGIDMPIRMMEREHEDHDAGLEKIRELTNGMEPPTDAPPAWAELYTGLEVLETDLRQHIYLENNILFARALGH